MKRAKLRRLAHLKCFAKQTTYRTPRWHDMDHASFAISSRCSWDKFMIVYLLSLLTGSLSPVELASFHIRRLLIVQAKANGMVRWWFDGR